MINSIPSSFGIFIASIIPLVHGLKFKSSNYYLFEFQKFFLNPPKIIPTKIDYSYLTKICAYVLINRKRIIYNCKLNRHEKLSTAKSSNVAIPMRTL